VRRFIAAFKTPLANSPLARFADADIVATLKRR
jgi:hypothetical protein